MTRLTLPQILGRAMTSLPFIATAPKLGILAVSNAPPLLRPLSLISSSETMLFTWPLNHWLDFYSYLKLLFILSCSITLFYHVLVLLPVRYITFDTNLRSLKRHTIGSLRYLSSWISGSLFALLILGK